MPILRGRRPRELPAPLRWEPGEEVNYHGATLRARELLERHLSESELKELARTGTIAVRGSRGGRYYIHVEPLGNGYTVESDYHAFCVHAFGYNGQPAYYVGADSVIAILLTLRTDEAAFLGRAVPYGRPAHARYGEIRERFRAVYAMYDEPLRYLGRR